MTPSTSAGAIPSFPLVSQILLFAGVPLKVTLYLETLVEKDPKICKNWKYIIGHTKLDANIRIITRLIP